MTLAQAILAALVAGALYGVLAAGVGLIFAVTGRLHFAMAATFVLTVYVAADLVDRGVPTPIAVAAGLSVGVLLGVLVEVVVYAPIVRRAPDVALLSVFVAGIGVVTVTENAIRLIWPDADSRQLPVGFAAERIELGHGLGVTNVDVLLFALALAMVGSLHLLLRRTAFGQQVRATQGNPGLAVLVGISERRVRLIVFAVGSALVAAVAVMTAIRSTVTPGGGLQPAFLAVVVLFLAGAGSSPVRFGAAGLAVGLAEALCAVYLSSAWSPVVVFGLLFAYIAASPSWISFRQLRTSRTLLAEASA